MKAFAKIKWSLCFGSFLILSALCDPLPVEGITVVAPNVELDTLGTFKHVNDIEYSDGYLYIIDTRDQYSASPDHLYRLNIETLEIDTVMYPSDFPSGWTYPKCFTWHYDGAILIGDLIAGEPFRPGRILRYFNGETNEFVGTVLANPLDILALPDSSVLISDVGASSSEDGFVDRFSFDGSERHNVLSGGDYIGMCFGHDGAVYVCAKGHFVNDHDEIIRISDPDTTLYYQGLHARHMAFAPLNSFNGDMYIVNNSSILELADMDGDEIPDTSMVIATLSSYLSSIAFDSLGHMYIGEQTDTITTYLWRLREGEGPSGPTICSQFGKQCASVTFYEKTSNIYTYTIPIDDPRLSTNVDEGPPDFQYDFKGTPEEYYDVYISDGEGNLDYENGKFVTIGCYFDAEDVGVGNNIVAVSLDFTDGTHKWATCVSDFALGTWLDDDETFNYGYVRNALGPNDGVSTYMGCHQSSMTLGFMDASHVRLTSVDVKKGGVGDWISYLPADVESVDVYDYIRFKGIVTDLNEDGVAEIPIWSYNSFEFDLDSNNPGVFITQADSSGNFTYPPEDTQPEGLECTAENFWPFWFSLNDSLAVPFLLTAGRGCVTCNIDSMVAYLQSDASIVYDAVGIPSNPNHILNIQIIGYPPNDEDMYAPENVSFLKSYCFKYIGPVGFPFLTNADSSGWLNIAVSHLSAAYDTFAVGLGEFFRFLPDSATLLVFRDSTGAWVNATDLTVHQSQSFENAERRTKYRGFTGFWKFTAERYLTGRERDAALCINFGAHSGGTSCISLLVGIYSDELAKPILEDIFCGFNRSDAVCRSQWRSKWGRTVDGVLGLATSLPSIIGAWTQDIPAMLGFFNKFFSEGSSGPFNWLDARERILRDTEGRIKSYRTERIAGGGGSWKALGDGEDSVYFDLVFTNWQNVDLRIESGWDDPENPSILALTLKPNKILFQLLDTLEAMPELFVVSGQDTLVIPEVQEVGDSIFTAEIDISLLPNYIPGEKYSASIVTSGYDLFSNFGQQQDLAVLATITIEGDSLIGVTGSGLVIPPGAAQNTIFVTIIPGQPPEPPLPTVKPELSTDFDSCRFVEDLTQITPDGYELSVPAELILDFDTTEYKSLVDSTIAIFNYNSITSSWQLIGGEIDSVRGLISIAISKFGLFGVKVVPTSYFVAGDANGDGVIDLGDVLYLINYLYKGGPAPYPLAAGDCNCDGVVDLGDVLYLISYLYKGGSPPCS